MCTTVNILTPGMSNNAGILGVKKGTPLCATSPYHRVIRQERPCRYPIVHLSDRERAEVSSGDLPSTTTGLTTLTLTGAPTQGVLKN